MILLRYSTILLFTQPLLQSPRLKQRLGKEILEFIMAVKNAISVRLGKGLG